MILIIKNKLEIGEWSGSWYSKLCLDTTTFQYSIEEIEKSEAIKLIKDNHLIKSHITSDGTIWDTENKDFQVFINDCKTFTDCKTPQYQLIKHLRNETK